MKFVKILLPLIFCSAVIGGEVNSTPSTLLTKEYVTDDSKKFTNTPLIEAAIENNTDKLIQLLQQGADPNQANGRGDRAIMFASWFGNIEMLEALVESGADVNVRSLYQDPPLMWATMSKKMDAVRFLVKNGADIHLKSQFQITVLMEAAGAGHREMVDYYVDHGLDIYAFEKIGNDAAAWAERGGHHELAMHLRELKKKDADKLAEQQFVLKHHRDKTVRQKVAREAFLVDELSATADAGKSREDQKPILVYFYANYCPVCRATDPHLTAFMEKHHEKVKLVKVNIEKHNVYTDEDEQLMQKLRLENKLYGIPAFLLTSNRTDGKARVNKKIAKMGMQTLSDYESWILPFVAMN